MASLDNFHGQQTQQVSRYKNFPLFPWNKIQNNSVFSDTHTKVQKYLFSLLYVLCHKAIFIFSDTESFLTLHALHPWIGCNTQFTPLLFLSVHWPVRNTIIPHIIHYFCCILYRLLIHKFKCRAVICRLAPFPRSCFPCPEKSMCYFWPENDKSLALGNSSLWAVAMVNNQLINRNVLFHFCFSKPWFYTVHKWPHFELLVVF